MWPKTKIFKMAIGQSWSLLEFSKFFLLVTDSKQMDFREKVSNLDFDSCKGKTQNSTVQKVAYVMAILKSL